MQDAVVPLTAFGSGLWVQESEWDLISKMGWPGNGWRCVMHVLIRGNNACNLAPSGRLE